MSADPRIEAAANLIAGRDYPDYEPDLEFATDVLAAIDKASIVTTEEELQELPHDSVIRSEAFGVVRERFDSGWLAAGVEDDEFESSAKIAGREHRVLYRGQP